MRIVKRKIRKKCYFCGTTSKITEHHIVFKEFLGGDILEHNKEYLCKKCHDKFHKLAEPMVNILLAVIKKFMPKEMKKIGFLRTNEKRKKKRR